MGAGIYRKGSHEEASMRPLFFILGISVGIISIENRAEAQNYPWCAYYGGDGDGGGTNCGFTTFQQCLETVSGIGGFCQRNKAQ
jgi:hypothetical protein